MVFGSAGSLTSHKEDGIQVSELPNDNGRRILGQFLSVPVLSVSDLFPVDDKVDLLHHGQYNGDGNHKGTQGDDYPQSRSARKFQASKS